MNKPTVAIAVRHHDHVAGLGTYTRGLLGEMVHRSNRPHLTAYVNKPPNQAIPGLDYLVTSAAGNKLGARSQQFLWDQWSFPRAVHPARPDLVHWLHPTGSLLPTPGKTVITVHDVTPWQSEAYHRDRRMRFYLGVDARAIRRADRLIAVSEYTRKEMVTVLGIDPTIIDVVYEAGPERVRENPGRPSVSEPYVLFMGGSEVRKNPLRTIRAFLAADLPTQTKLVITGRIQRSPVDEELPPLLESLSRPARGRIVLAGMVDDQELSRLFGHAICFAFPSLREGFGLPVLEAMAYGTPVVTSTTASLPEVGGQAAVLVDPLDEAALAASFTKLARDEAFRRDRIKAGFQNLQRFSWAKAAQETTGVYAKTLA